MRRTYEAEDEEEADEDGEWDSDGEEDTGEDSELEDVDDAEEEEHRGRARKRRVPLDLLDGTFELTLSCRVKLWLNDSIADGQQQTEATDAGHYT